MGAASAFQIVQAQTIVDLFFRPGGSMNTRTRHIQTGFSEPTRSLQVLATGLTASWMQYLLGRFAGP